MKTLMVCCAHNDDHILGAGGTLYNYHKKGWKTLNVVWSFGESSHPWLKNKVTRDMRFSEAKKADRLLGIEKTFYLGASEGKFKEADDALHKLQRIMSIARPSMILTHSPSDPHPDHKAVFHYVIEITEKIGLDCDIYCFDVWNFFNVRKPVPRMVEDISMSFQHKLRAFRLHKSQRMTMLTMIPAMFARALSGGLLFGYKYAEVFEKAR